MGPGESGGVPARMAGLKVEPEKQACSAAFKLETARNELTRSRRSLPCGVQACRGPLKPGHPGTSSWRGEAGLCRSLPSFAPAAQARTATRKLGPPRASVRRAGTSLLGAVQAWIGASRLAPGRIGLELAGRSFRAGGAGPAKCLALRQHASPNRWRGEHGPRGRVEAGRRMARMRSQAAAPRYPDRRLGLRRGLTR